MDANDLEKLFQNDGHNPQDAESILEENATKKAIFRLDEYKRGDGSVVQMTDQQLGVMQKTATAPAKDSDYRQALLLARFMNPEEADRAVNAIAFCQRYGGDMRPIIDKIIARCAVKGARVEDIKDMLTHMRLTTTSSGNNGNRDSKRLLH